VKHYKISFIEQHGEAEPKSPLGVWQTQFTPNRVLNLFDLRADPFERCTSRICYADWQIHRAFLMVPAQALVEKMLETFKEFPPRAKAASFTVSDAMEKIETASPNQN
jgi:arylsulfatase